MKFPGVWAAEPPLSKNVRTVKNAAIKSEDRNPLRIGVYSDKSTGRYIHSNRHQANWIVLLMRIVYLIVDWMRKPSIISFGVEYESKTGRTSTQKSPEEKSLILKSPGSPPELPTADSSILFDWFSCAVFQPATRSGLLNHW
jgi:hypothetical protein